MAFHRYQVTFTADGEVESNIELPDETPQKRAIIVRAETPNAAERAAEDLYSLAE